MNTHNSDTPSTGFQKSQPSAPLRFTMPLGTRIILLLCVWLIGLVISSVVSYILVRNGITPPKIRIATIVQDIMMFILPALVTAMLVTRRPAELLGVDYFPARFLPWLLSIATLLFSIPAMESLIKWNEGLSLPPSMQGIEDWMRQAEDNAAQMIYVLTGGTSIGSLIMSILIVGIFAGFSEELLFRGGLQRLLSTGGFNHHAAIWITAFIFSAIHMQFFGFFPRLLLGAFFGYLLYWTGSLWIPIVIHALNNTIVVVTMWRENIAKLNSSTETVPSNEIASSISPILAVCSVIIVGLLLYNISKYCRR